MAGRLRACLVWVPLRKSLNVGKRRDYYSYSYYPKPVNINKTPITSRQEKTHMIGSMDRSFTDQSTLQEDERMALSFMDAQNCSNRSK
ncbi:PTPRU phosphatase, partial [Polyodon spathula]|nr:PTPRU phosphatase [Polyodon spathula]